MNINNIKLKDGLSLIEASAGTGKSFTLSHIVIRSIFENNINPENILLLSFTNNTCKELSLKINERIDNFENYITNKTSDVDITLKNWCDNFIKNNPNKAIMTALSWLYRRAVIKDFNWSSLKLLPKLCSMIAPTTIAVKPKKAPKKRIIICSKKKSCQFS